MQNSSNNKHFDAARHVSGLSQFLDDMSVPEGTLHAAVFYAKTAHGHIKSLNIALALAHKGVHAVLTASDIRGENQIGGIIPDEPLLADGDVHFWGQPIAVVVAETAALAREAALSIECDIEALPVITDPREAAAQGQLIMPARTVETGDVDAVWSECDIVIEDKAESGGQEHLYLETQGAFAVPTEGGGVRIVSSTQGPTAVQRAAAKVLGLPMHLIEVDVLRLGGGFGGKEDQATPWAIMAAMAALKLNRAVKLTLPRQEDMRMTGKRHPYSSDFKIGLTKAGKILALEATFYQDAGAAADLSPAVLDRTLFHCTNSYFIPNVRAIGISCRTNVPPNTAFRGFGGPQGMFLIEAAIYRAAEAMGVEASVIQRVNLLRDGDTFPYGQVTERCQAERTWDETAQTFALEAAQKRITDFNAQNILYKKGIAVMPICFGISFTNTMMNQASALVHIYSDGSVSISTGAVEMGQGVNTKIAQTAMAIFGLPEERIKVQTTNTSRAANTSPTAASAGADLNGKATEIACVGLRERLLALARTELRCEEQDTLTFHQEKIWHNGVETSLTWNMLVQTAFFQRIKLSEQAQYATPLIHFDKTTMKGRPFAYHVYGTAIFEVTVDCLRGVYEVESVQAVHDFGQSFNHTVDLGQAEGGIMQGIGWMTMEEVIYDRNGRLLTDALSTYKIPDIYAAPKRIDVRFLENSENPMGIMNSKAVGEPPFMYGIGAYFALMNALKAFRPDKRLLLKAPMSPERVLMELYAAAPVNT
ncbi:MAG: xanthine dehydrogenase molybdopterin binding subunit [Candidatus Kapaibacteriota bacterium]